MSKVLEFNELARKNREMKFGSMEYNSLLPDLQIMINNMYGKLIPSFNYVTDSHLCPNLESYNVHYNDEDFKEFNNKLFGKKENNVVINHFENVENDMTESLEKGRSLGKSA